MWHWKKVELSIELEGQDCTQIPSAFRRVALTSTVLFDPSGCVVV
jgi:hypothetical protein